ncbi:MAG: amidohydrolase family protein [Planctomycetaceae bacterium]|nr:amidohydrolase family protein [Planctomycetaceae bacterium]
MFDIPAIDVHGHYGRNLREGVPDFVNDFMTADAAEVARRARAVNIAWTIVSPLQSLFPRFHGDAVAGNNSAARDIVATDGLLQYVVIDPRKPETYQQADEMLRQPRCVGIKIHPEEHGYPVAEFGRPMFEFAAERKAVILSHSSEQLSLASDLVRFANEFPEMKLLLAHIGCGWDGDPTHQVRAIQSSRHGNVFADTSSARSITPNLIEWAVGEIGAERVLFGTDTPLYHTSMQRIRIEHAQISDRDMRLILRENAIRLFGLQELTGVTEVAASGQATM